MNATPSSLAPYVGRDYHSRGACTLGSSWPLTNKGVGFSIMMIDNIVKEKINSDEAILF